MLAVIKTCGKQYMVKPGEVINVEKIQGENGSKVQFSEVLMLSNEEGNVKVGTPFVDGARVNGVILGEKKGEKITIFKFRRRKGYRNKTGYRQKYTSVKIDSING